MGFIKKICKVIRNVILVALFLAFLGVISIPIINNMSAKKIVKELKKLPVPQKTEVVDSCYKAEKIAGNGNGMQYIGTILIKSDLSIDELEAFYSKYQKKELECTVVDQKNPELDFFDYEDELRFSEYDNRKGNYYIVFSWGEGISPFDELDIRGY